MRRDSPIEYNTNAHMVGRTCELCGDSFEQPETTADHLEANDLPVVCDVCYDEMGDLSADMYSSNIVNRLWTLGDYMRERDLPNKAATIEQLAAKMEACEPLIEAIEAWKSGDVKHGEAGLKAAIEKYEP